MALTVDQPDGRGHVNIFGRVQDDSCICGRLFMSGSRLISPAGIHDKGGGDIHNPAWTKLRPGDEVRMSVLGNGAALNVAGKWLIASRLGHGMTAGTFLVQVNSEFVKVSNVRYVDL